MELSAWVLVIVFHVEFSTAAVTVDMPDKATCLAASAVARELPSAVAGLCLSREPISDKQKGG